MSAFDLGREGLEECLPIHLSTGTTRRLIRQWKEKRGNLLRRHLFNMAPGLVDTLRELDLIAVVPIPQSAGRSARRGHASAREVAEYIASRIGRPLVDLLELAPGESARMTGKSRFERDHAPNPFRISESFAFDHPVFPIIESRVFSGEPIPILVVDDLITSGATLARAAAVLHGFLPRARIHTSGLGLRPPIKPVRPEYLEPECP